MLQRPKLREAHESPRITSDLGDLRFRSLLSHDDWAALPQGTRRRFSKRVADGKTVVYAGEVVETEMNFAGWVFAQIARLAGGPLPLYRDAHVPAVVSVTEDMKNGGQIWTRVYTRRSGFPQVIHSSKRFAGKTGLEEHVGHGVGMALRVERNGAALVFRSANYFFRAGSLRHVLPDWLTPGALTVTHAEEGDARFSFRLEIVHPVFGPIIRQFATFHEVMS